MRVYASADSTAVARTALFVASVSELDPIFHHDVVLVPPMLTGRAE